MLMTRLKNAFSLLSRVKVNSSPLEEKEGAWEDVTLFLLSPGVDTYIVSSFYLSLKTLSLFRIPSVMFKENNSVVIPYLSKQTKGHKDESRIIQRFIGNLTPYANNIMNL